MFIKDQLPWYLFIRPDAPTFTVVELLISQLSQLLNSNLRRP